MAIITKGPNLQKGSEADFTLNITDLLAHPSVSGDAYFSTQSNWDKVFVNYTSEGNQKEILIFENVDSGTSDSANFGVFSGARNTFEVQSVIIMDKQGGYLKIKRDLLTVEDFDVSFSNDIFTLLASDEPGFDRSGTFSYENNIITKTSAVDGYNLVIRSNEEASGDFSLEININTDGEYIFGMGADPFDSGGSLYPNYGLTLELSTRYFWESIEGTNKNNGIDFSSQPNSFAGYSFRFERISGNLKVFRKEPLGSSFIQIYDYGTVNGPLYFEYVCWTSGSQLEIVSASGFSIPSQNSITSFTASPDSTGTFTFENNVLTKTSGAGGSGAWDLTVRSDQEASGDFSVEVNIIVDSDHLLGMGTGSITVSSDNPADYGVYTDSNGTLYATTDTAPKFYAILNRDVLEGDTFKWKRASGNLTLSLKRSGESSFTQIYDYGAVSDTLYFHSQPYNLNSIEIISSTGFSIPTTTTTTTTTAVNWDYSGTDYDFSNGGLATIGTGSPTNVTVFGTNQATGSCYIEFTPQSSTASNFNRIGIAMTDSISSTVPQNSRVHTLAFGQTTDKVLVFSNGSFDLNLLNSTTTYAGDGTEVFRVEVFTDRVEYSKNGVVFFTDDQSKTGDLDGALAGYPPYFPFIYINNGSWELSDIKISGFDEE